MKSSAWKDIAAEPPCWDTQTCFLKLQSSRKLKMTYSSLRDYFLKHHLGQITRTRRRNTQEVFHLAGAIGQAVSETLSKDGERYIKPLEQDDSKILDDISIAGIINFPISLIERHALNYYETLGFTNQNQIFADSHSRNLRLAKEDLTLLLNIAKDEINERFYITSQLIG